MKQSGMNQSTFIKIRTLSLQRDHHLGDIFPGLVRFSSAPATGSNSQNSNVSSPAEEEWTEVVHSEGGIYYWNQKTG